MNPYFIIYNRYFESLPKRDRIRLMKKDLKSLFNQIKNEKNLKKKKDLRYLIHWFSMCIKRSEKKK